MMKMSSSSQSLDPLVEFTPSAISFPPKISPPIRCDLRPEHHSLATKFTCFTKLPCELQLRVWEEVELKPRLVVIKEYTDGAEPGPAPLHSSSMPTQSLLYTCTLSRHVALQSYKPAFKARPRSSNAQVVYYQGEGTTQGRYALASFENDIFYFPDLAMSNHFPILVENSQDASKVKNVVLVGQERWPGLDWYMLAYRVFPNLDHLYMVKHRLVVPGTKEQEDQEMEMRETKEKEFEEKVKKSTWMLLGDRGRDRKQGTRCKRDEEGRIVRWNLPGVTFLGEREFGQLMKGF